MILGPEASLKKSRWRPRWLEMASEELQSLKNAGRMINLACCLVLFPQDNPPALEKAETEIQGLRSWSWACFCVWVSFCSCLVGCRAAWLLLNCCCVAAAAWLLLLWLLLHWRSLSWACFFAFGLQFSCFCCVFGVFCCFLFPLFVFVLCVCVFPLFVYVCCSWLVCFVVCLCVLQRVWGARQIMSCKGSGAQETLCLAEGLGRKTHYVLHRGWGRQVQI